MGVGVTLVTFGSSVIVGVIVIVVVAVPVMVGVIAGSSVSLELGKFSIPIIKTSVLSDDLFPAPSSE